jgi:integrase
MCPNSSPEAFIFPNKKGGFMDNNNYWKRVLHRLERELELPKLTFQVIRRTIAMLAQKKEEGDSEGHSRLAQTLPHRNDS